MLSYAQRDRGTKRRREKGGFEGQEQDEEQVIIEGRGEKVMETVSGTV